MFDFFKEVYLEAKGVDVEALKAEKKKIKEEQKKNKFIFSRSSKIIIYVFGLVYLLIAGLNIFLMKDFGGANVYYIMRFLFLSICDIAVLVCLAIGKKQTEVAALILVVVFIITQYLGVFL